MVTANFGKLATFSVSDVTTASFTAIPQIQTFGLPDITREKIDATVLESVGTEYILGGVENGDCKFSLIENEANTIHKWMRDQTNASTSSLHNFKLQLNGSTSSVQFSGSFQSRTQGEITNRGIVTVDYTVAVSNGLNFV